jgi:hypothetical protein
MAWKKLVMLVLLFALCFPRASLPQEEIPLENACEIQLLLISDELMQTVGKLDEIYNDVKKMAPSHPKLSSDMEQDIDIATILDFTKKETVAFAVSDSMSYIQLTSWMCEYEAELLTATGLLVGYEKKTSGNVRTKFSPLGFVEVRKSLLKESQRRTTWAAGGMELAWNSIHDKAILQKLFEAKNVILSTLRLYDEAMQTLEAYISHKKEEEKKTRNRSY